MQDLFVNVLTVILIAVIYIGLPILLTILVIRGWKRLRQPSSKRYRIFSAVSIPLLLLNAVPGFFITWKEQGSGVDAADYWYALLCIFYLITFVVTFFECRFRALWIGPIRAVAGTMLGIAAATSLILLGGLLLLAGVCAHSGGQRDTSITISRGGKSVRLTPGGMDGVYLDPQGHPYEVYDKDKVIDRDGNSYGFHENGRAD